MSSKLSPASEECRHRPEECGGVALSEGVAHLLGGSVVPRLVGAQPGVRVSVCHGEARQVFSRSEHLPGPEHFPPGAVITHPGTLTLLAGHSGHCWGPRQQQQQDRQHGDMEITDGI